MGKLMGDIPCPDCDQTFDTLDDLFNHALATHQKEGDVQTITKQDFTQVDSHWIFAFDGMLLNLERDPAGVFRLSVMGMLNEIPPATAYPSEPEWEVALRAANYLVPFMKLAKSRESA